MFVSHNLSPSKKPFQKPNILRRKTKVSAIRSACKPSAPTVAAEPKPDTCKDAVPRLKRVQLEVVAQDIACSPTHTCTSVASIQDVDMREKETNTVEETSLVDEVQHSTEHKVVDVEAFLNGSQTTQYKTEHEDQTKLEDNSVHKWEIDFENTSDEIVLEPYEGLQVLTEDKLDEDLQPLAVDYDHLTIRPGKFKCGEPDCSKVFVTEQKLRRHRAVHNKQRPRPAPAAVECPARGAGGAGGAEGTGGAGGAEGTGGAGAGARCGRVFAARDQLARHLQEDHAPEDALHGCGECGRRFFWAVGLRAHARAHLSRGALHACLWPGCGRAFRQPCRLREHARAHTGDRPYRCAHPGCPWAFRTASKLVRHARRHTGERRHACACGRAFRRREHLREHQARHRPRPHTEDNPGKRRASRIPDLPDVLPGPGAEPAEPPPAPIDDEFMVRLVPLETETAASVEGVRETETEEGRAARTHCTWPLSHAADSVTEEPACCVRSDLFLAAHDDDSQQMIAGAGSAEPVLEATSLPGLGLLDLMQEELMYTDAVDESSFQVLLLSEELG